MTRRRDSAVFGVAIAALSILLFGARWLGATPPPPTPATAVPTINRSYAHGASQADSTAVLDTTREGVIVDAHGTAVGPIATPTSAPFTTALAQLLFGVVDTTQSSGGGDSKSIYFAIGTGGEFIGKLIAGATQQFMFRGDVDTVIGSKGQNAEGGELILHGGDGCDNNTACRAGSIRLFGGKGGLLSGHDGGFELDSGPNPTGASAAFSSSPMCAADGCIGVDNVKVLQIGNINPGGSTSLWGAALQMITDSHGTFDVRDSNSVRRLDLHDDVTMRGLNNFFFQTLDGVDAITFDRSTQAFDVQVNGIDKTLFAATTGSQITLSQYAGAPALLVEAHNTSGAGDAATTTAVASNHKLMRVTNNGSELFSVGTGGGDDVVITGPMAGDYGPLVCVATSTTGVALTLDSSQNGAGGGAYAVESIGRDTQYGTRYAYNSFRVTYNNTSDLWINNDPDDGGSGEVAIGHWVAVAGGARLQVQGTISSTNGSTGHATCWNGTVLSYCTSVVASDGTCTCH